MARYRAPNHLPQDIILRSDFADACADRDLGAIFRISIKYGVGFTPSHLARRCEMTVSKVQDYAKGRTLAQSMAIFERVCDGLHIPGNMLGVVRRPWEDGDFLGGADSSDSALPVTAYSGRGLITRRQWNDVIEDASERVWLYGMAEFGYATDDEVPVLLAEAMARGCEVQVLLLDPAYPGAAEIDFCEGSPSGTLSARINAALARFQKMQARCGSGMTIRIYDMHPSVSVIRGDDEMIVTPYLRYFTGSNSPTFEFRAERSPKIFDRYARHFEETWNHSKEWQ